MRKEIQKIKIALTSSCSLRCLHCNIDKKSGKDIDLDDAKKAIDFFLNTSGKFKRLELYGGEPFLRFPLVKKLFSYARKNAFKKNKRISLSIATNGTIMNSDIINWLKKNKINISISFSGSRESHNLLRKFPDGSGSHNVVLNNLKSMLSKISPDYLVCLYCVDKDFVKNMVEDFNKIISIGFKIANIECVSGRGWRKKYYNSFAANMKKIIEIIEDGIESNRFIFMESFIEFIRRKKIESLICPVYRDLEVYPDGKLGFYPYAFVNYEIVKDIISAGDCDRGLNKKYIECVFPSKECSNCVKDYYKIEGLDDGSFAYSIRTKMLEKFFLKILRKSQSNINYRNYLKEIFYLLDKTYV